ncbi:uncharacterized protein LOC135370183 [Ornithodoros turicata]|uniref:uncharacterized protein LOC135370183 n=1 Tax=Ornithodoros turicata TaxID=34597 RepID=UPI0031393AAC
MESPDVKKPTVPSAGNSGGRKVNTSKSTRTPDGGQQPTDKGTLEAKIGPTDNHPNEPTSTQDASNAKQPSASKDSKDSRHELSAVRDVGAPQAVKDQKPKGPTATDSGRHPDDGIEPGTPPEPSKAVEVAPRKGGRDLVGVSQPPSHERRKSIAQEILQAATWPSVCIEGQPAEIAVGPDGPILTILPPWPEAVEDAPLSGALSPAETVSSDIHDVLSPSGPSGITSPATTTGESTVPPLSSSPSRSPSSSSPGRRWGSRSPGLSTSGLSETFSDLSDEDQTSQNRRECCFIASLALIIFLVVLLVILWYMLNNKVVEENTAEEERRRPQLKQFYCDTPLCKRFSRDVVGYLKWSSAPCLDLFSFVCGGFRKEATNELYGAATPNDMYSRIDNHIEDKYIEDRFNEFEIYREPVINMAELGESTMGVCLRTHMATVPADIKEYGDVSALPYKPSWHIRPAGGLFTNFFTIMGPAKLMYSVFPKKLGVPRGPHVYPLEPLAPRVLYESETFRQHFKAAITDIVKEVSTISVTGRAFNFSFNALWDLQKILPDRKVDLFSAGYIRMELLKISNAPLAKEIMDYYNIQSERDQKVVIHYSSYFDKFSRLMGKYGHSGTRGASILHGSLLRGVMDKRPLSSKLYMMMKRGIYGPVSDKRLCIESLGEYQRAFQFDLLREYMHTDELAELMRTQPVTEQIKSIALRVINSLNIFTDDERATAQNKVGDLKIFYLYPDVNVSRTESVEYPFSTEHMADQPTRDVHGNYRQSINMTLYAQQYVLPEDDLRWTYMDPLDRDPTYYPDLNTLLITPQSMQRVLETMKYLERVIPVDMPMYMFPAAREMFHAYGYLGQTIDDSGVLRTWYSNTTRKNYDEIKDCFETLLKRYKMNYTEYDIHDIIAETAILNPIFELYRSQTRSRRHIHKARASESFLGDLPYFTSDQLFIIALATNLCEKYLPEHLEIMREIGMRTARTKVNFLFKNWEKFGKIFDCQPGDYMVGDTFCRASIPSAYPPPQ